MRGYASSEDSRRGRGTRNAGSARRSACAKRGRVSRELSWLLMDPFVLVVATKSDTSTLDRDDRHDPLAAILRVVASIDEIRARYLRSIGEDEWADLVAKRDVSQIREAERGLTRCSSDELRRDLALLGRVPLRAPQFDQMVTSYLVLREDDPSPSLWPSMVMRLPEPDGARDGAEWMTLHKILDGPHPVAVQALNHLRSLVPFMPDLSRWIAAVRKIGEEGIGWADQCFVLLDYLVEGAVDRLVAEGAQGGIESLDDPRRALKAEYLRSIGENEWAAQVEQDDPALRERLRSTLLNGPVGRRLDWPGSTADEDELWSAG